MKKSRAKSRNMLFVILAVIALLCSALYFENLIRKAEPESINANAVASKSSNIPANYAPSQTQASYVNFEQMLANNEMIKDLPEKAVILLRFYGFNPQGEKAWGNSYILKRGSASQGVVDNPDLALWIPSRYLASLTSDNLCSLVKLAKANQELSIRTSLSTMSLLWKFKSMFKYRECLGF